MDLPVLCTLTAAKLEERRREILDVIRSIQIGTSTIPGGYAYAFKPASDVLAQLSRLVDLERQCCRFLTFKIVLQPGELPIQLEITGPPQAKVVIAELFGGLSSYTNP